MTPDSIFNICGQKFNLHIFLYVSMVSRWSMKAETTVLRRFILMFPGGSDVQISQDTEVENSAG